MGLFKRKKEVKKEELPPLPSAQKLPPLPKIEEPKFPVFPEKKQDISETPMDQESEPIFVKIDKFQAANENFSKIKEKLKDVESSLANLREIKNKEEQELDEWEQEVQLIKTKIAKIDDSLFKKIGLD